MYRIVYLDVFLESGQTQRLTYWLPKSEESKKFFEKLSHLMNKCSLDLNKRSIDYVSVAFSVGNISFSYSKCIGFSFQYIDTEALEPTPFSVVYNLQ